MRLSEIITQLIRLGSGEQVSFDIFDRDSLYSLASTRLVYSLESEKMICLIRGLVMLEMDSERFSFGSTTPVSRLLKILRRRHTDDSEQEVTDLINWALSHRVNSYVPFGSHVPLDIKSISDYEEELRRNEQHRLAMQKADELRSKKAKQKRQENYARHSAIAKANNDERAEISKRLKKLVVKSRFKFIVESDKPINFFPEYFAEIDGKEFKKIPTDLLEKLYLKLEHASRGNAWFELRKVIASHLKQDHNK